MERCYEIIKRPLVTEKATLLGEKQNAYVFEVLKDASKTEVKEAVEKIFKVKVSSINTMTNHGKSKRSGKHMKKRSNWKKAIVTLPEGQKIELFENA